ncbi:unnamed protein product [Pylaiella littoralis]
MGSSAAVPAAAAAAAAAAVGSIVDDDAASQWDVASRKSGASGLSSATTGRVSGGAGAGAGAGAGGVNDDDAASQYAGSSVAGGGGGGGGGRSGSAAGSGALHNQSWRRVASDRAAGEDGGAAGKGVMMRRARRGTGDRSGGSGSPSGRNSQSIGNTTVDSSLQDSDRESFTSRVGSYALTDIGVDFSEQERGHQAGRGAAAAGSVAESGGGGVLSPTSTLLRSVQGMSELGTERDSYGSDGYTNASDSPGAQSGWERAWMRQRNDARYFAGGPQQG